MAEATGILLLNAEDNDLTGLTITEEGSNDLTITSGAAAHGSLGYNFAFSGNSGENNLYFYKTFTSGADIYARCYFYIPSSFDGTTSTLTTMSLNYSATGLLALLLFHETPINKLWPLFASWPRYF